MTFGRWGFSPGCSETSNNVSSGVRCSSGHSPVCNLALGATGDRSIQTPTSMAAASATQRRHQAEEDRLVWIPRQHAVHELAACPHQLTRDADEGIDFAMQLEHPRRHTFVMHSDNLSNLSRMARECNASIFVKNGPSQAGLGWKGEGFTSFTIASPTGEGMTSPRSFSRWRRCTLVGAFRIV